MAFLKYISYLYIVFAVAFLIDGIMKVNEGGNGIISFVFAGLAAFMFFFRRKYSKKFSDRANGK
jgi:positive regulator of sigma E activity